MRWSADWADSCPKTFAFPHVAVSIGVNGTPAIVLADGQVIPGYQPAPQVAKLALGAK